MITLQYCDALSGAGKTHVLTDAAADVARSGGCVLFVQPTNKLIAESASSMTSRHPDVDCRVINGDTTDDDVVRTIINHLHRPDLYGHVLFITHTSFWRLPFVRSGLHLIIDEAPTVHELFDLRVPDCHDHVTDHVRTNPEGARYSEIVVANDGAIRAIAENRNKDTIRGQFMPLAKRLQDGSNWSNYVIEADYRQLVRNSGTKRKLTVISTLNPSALDGFASVTIAGARLQESFLFQLWSRDKCVALTRSEALVEKLRYVEHPNGHLITISYAIEKDWSKNLRDKSNRELWHKVLEAVERETGQLPFAWVSNVDTDKDGLFTTKRNAVRLPNEPHGLNTFQQYETIVYLAARNLTPAQFKFFESFKGMSAKEVRTAVYYHAAYQAVMRGAIRDPDNHNPKHIIVVDRGLADYLADVFKGATVTKLDGDFDLPVMSAKAGRPREYENDAARKRAWRERQSEARRSEQSQVVTDNDSGLQT